MTRYLTFDQAVTYFKDELGLEVKKQWLYRQSALGRLTFFPMGRVKVCAEADLLAFVENQRTRAQHRGDQLNRPAPRQRRQAFVRREIDPDIREAVMGKR